MACGGDDQSSSKKADNSDAKPSVKPSDQKAEPEAYVKRQADNPEIAIETSFGTMKFELFRDVAPGHVDSMLARAREGFYDSLKIFRVIAGFMAQTGDPMNVGMGNAGYNLTAEFSDLPHKRGTLSMARSQQPNSASCQFFICFNRVSHLDGKYTVFGQMMEGEDVLARLEAVKVTKNPKTGENALPAEDVYMKKMTILKDNKPEKSK
ncbi:MAG: peptidylprolyl isomerase [candidate division Zixibacteria bacterium]|nr:peptidylprolyl isomerase [candidate division Zixibacteria bacterium]